MLFNTFNVNTPEATLSYNLQYYPYGPFPINFKFTAMDDAEAVSYARYKLGRVACGEQDGREPGYAVGTLTNMQTGKKFRVEVEA